MPIENADPAEVLKPKRSLFEIINQMVTDLKLLALKEVELARAEMSEKTKTMSAGGGLILAGAFLAFVAFFVLVACLVLILDQWMPAWAAAAIVFGGFTLIAAILIGMGVSMIKESQPMQPTNAIDNIKKDIEWINPKKR